MKFGEKRNVCFLKHWHIRDLLLIS